MNVEQNARLTHWLEILVHRGGSDLFLVVGRSPAIRVHGEVLGLEEGAAGSCGYRGRVGSGAC